MKKIICLIFLWALFTAKPVFAQDSLPVRYYEALITKVQSASPSPSNPLQKIQTVTVKITSGNLKNNIYRLDIPVVANDEGNRFSAGDRIIVSHDKTPTGQDNLLIVDYVRKTPLFVLFFIFLSVVFAIGRWRGLTSFLGMIFTFIIIIQFIIPNILNGTDPVIVSLLAALLIVPPSFFLSHGLNQKTMIAIGATFLSLVLTAIIAFIFIKITQLTGYSAEEAVYLQAIKGNAFNIQGLLLAGIIIGAMGILDDITISQASVVNELHKANHKLTRRELYEKAMKVGRDHIASLVNTLVLVYAGASLPLFLLFTNSGMSYSMAVSNEMIVTEIVRTLVSSIGLIAAVPITTLLASYKIK